MIKNIEELFLKIAKVTILIVMTLGLLGALGLAIAALYEYTKSPQEPLPATKAPDKEISVDDLLKSLEPKKEDAKTQSSKPTEDASKSPAPTLAYLEEMTKLYRCSQQFAKAVGAELEDAAGDAGRIEELRGKLEDISKRPNHGAPYVTSAVSFTCAALANPKVIKMKTDGMVKAVFYPTLNFHLKKWVENQGEKEDFNNREIRRVAAVRNAEQIRIASSRAIAFTYISAAGVAFVTFMSLALYLLGAKIEGNLREMNRSILARSGATMHQ